MKKRGPELVKSLLSYILLAALIVFLLFPFYWTFVTSIKSSAELYGQTVTYWPKMPTLSRIEGFLANTTF